MERIAIVSILTALSVPFTTTRATADDDYKKICRVNENLRVLDDDAMQIHAGPLRSTPRRRNTKLDAVTVKTRAPSSLPHPST